MLIEIIRGKSSQNSTIGKLYVDGVFECFTLEDVVRAVKIPKITAIPIGTYKVIIDKSKRFNRLLPLILSVPNFDGVRMHPGNKAVDTEGCILVGTTTGVDWVGNSVKAFDKLFAKMTAAKEITLIIR